MSYLTLAASSGSRATGAPTTASHTPTPSEERLNEKDELVQAVCACLIERGVARVAYQLLLSCVFLFSFFSLAF